MSVVIESEEERAALRRFAGLDMTIPTAMTSVGMESKQKDVVMRLIYAMQEQLNPVND